MVGINIQQAVQIFADSILTLGAEIGRNVKGSLLLDSDNKMECATITISFSFDGLKSKPFLELEDTNIYNFYQRLEEISKLIILNGVKTDNSN